MQNSARELWLAFVAVVGITVLYLFVVITQGGIPDAREFFGHSFGVIGFLLMLMTEFLYSQRKRSRSARWGKMANWLQFHIFTGIVGPYLVLLHSSWKFNGLAGVVTLLMIVVVLSGFVGRYIYTAVPRSADGAVLESDDLEQAIADSETTLQNWLTAYPRTANQLRPLLASAGGQGQNELALIFGRGLLEWQTRFQWWQLKNQLQGLPREQIHQLESLLRRRQVLQRQIASLAMARRLLALWHAVHVPIGMTLFFAAFVHIIGAIYYATLLK
ncbi:MAG: hypothetical protein HUU38_05755 [Anaerolineales bacterium]|jgi:hypothetical protein|nr:hypothetical protein [Anaerolineales bacterium]